MPESAQRPKEDTPQSPPRAEEPRRDEAYRKLGLTERALLMAGD
jgi:hypothetical protein